VQSAIGETRPAQDSAETLHTHPSQGPQHTTSTTGRTRQSTAPASSATIRRARTDPRCPRTTLAWRRAPSPTSRSAPHAVRSGTRTQTGTTASTEYAYEHRWGTSWGISRPESDQQCVTRPDNDTTTNLVTNAISTSIVNERQAPDDTLNQRVAGSSPTRPTKSRPGRA